jgi:uncharacterized damage-inducible protein DinB
MVTKADEENTEFWLRGPVPGIIDVLQPAAYALLQTNKELYEYTNNFPGDRLWEQVYGKASVGFHLQHITGVMDRMLTYAKGESLSKEQFDFLKNEGVANDAISLENLQNDFTNMLTRALNYFKTIKEDKVKEKRSVGRKNLPSTVIGLLFHAAEHSQRHIGQLLVTVAILNIKK